MISVGRPVTSSHFVDEDDNPAGGTTYGEGFAIAWQNGPTREQGVDKSVRNGAFVEEVLLGCRGRLEFYQASRFACAANNVAIDCINDALNALKVRTAEREARGVEGKNIV